MGEERGTGTVAQRGLRVSRGKACGVWRAFRIAWLSRGRTRATKECGGTGAVGQRRQGCEYGHCACSRQRGSVHLELDRQWRRWGRIGTATCSAWFSEGSTRGARGRLWIRVCVLVLEIIIGSAHPATRRSDLHCTCPGGMRAFHERTRP